MVVAVMVAKLVSAVAVVAVTDVALIQITAARRKNLFVSYLN